MFSITIAALSLAAGQMGPRLLRNFTRDRGIQLTLGAFLGTFSYALMVLRSVRTQEEGAFTPHLSLTVGILLAFLCVATLVYFVDHMASRINVDTVIELVSDDVRSAIQRLTVDEPSPAPPPPAFWTGAMPIVDARHGYLQELDANGLADWAAENDTAIRLLVRPGDYVFPGTPSAMVLKPVDGADVAIHGAMALGATARELGRSRVRRAPARRGRGSRALAGHQRSPHRDQRARPPRCSALRRGVGVPAGRRASSRGSGAFS